jgi:hypothetical protein
VALEWEEVLRTELPTAARRIEVLMDLLLAPSARFFG